MKYGIIKNALPIDLCDEMADLMESLVDHSGENYKHNARDYYGIFNAIQSNVLQPILESEIGVELMPTYNFSRIYNKNSRLGKHVDRGASEYATTINLKNEKGSWPIWMHDDKASEPVAFDLKPGDLCWYKGTEVTHWRDTNVEGKVYQTFFMYVQKNGLYEKFAYDENYEEWKKDLENPLYHIF